jgi:hypothetical protein
MTRRILTFLILMLAAGTAQAATLLSDDFASTANWTITTGGVATIGTTTTLGGTVLPDVTNALDLRWTGAGAAYAVHDLGSAQDVLYVEFLLTVLNSSTQAAASYEDVVRVGPNASLSGAAMDIRIRKQSAYIGRFYGFPNYLQLNEVTWGTWDRVGFVLNRTAGTVAYYLNGRLVNSSTISAGDLRYIVIGGNVPSGWRFQVARLRVTTDAFPAYTAPENNVGRGHSWYIDPSLNADSYTSFTSWRGQHKEPFSPDGVNYIDGPIRRMPTSWSVPAAYDKIYFQGGTEQTNSALNTYPNLYLPSAPTTSAGRIEVTSYGTGRATLVGGIKVPAGAWTDTGSNNIYTTAVANLANLTGVWVNGYGLRIATAATSLTAEAGMYFADTGSGLLHVRLYENGVIPHAINPALYDTYLVATNGPAFASPWIWVHDINVAYGAVTAGTSATLENIVGLNGIAQPGTGGTLRNSRFVSNGSGYAYSGGGVGYAGSSPSTVSFSDGRKYYRNYFEGFGLGNVGSACVIAYNEFVNFTVNTLQAVEGVSTAANPLIITNNTIWHSPPHVQDSPFPLNEDQPGHGIALHSGFSGYAVVKNNLILNKHEKSIAGPYASNSFHIAPASPPIGGVWDYNASALFGSTTRHYLNEFDNNQAGLEAHLASNNIVGVGGNGASHDMKLTASPVANAALGTGKWDAAAIDGTLTTELLGTPVAGLPAELTTTIDGDAIGATPYVGAYGYDAPTPGASTGGVSPATGFPGYQFSAPISPF